jgi:putative hydrolase of the HAD superfamily
MIKVVFIDYMGTTVDEHGQEMGEIVRHICKNSAVHDPKQVQRFILDNRRRYEADSYLDAYLTEDEIVNRLISDMETQIGLTDEPDALRGLIRSHWVNAPVFPDAHIFFEQCPVPIYIITNNGRPYMEQALRRNGLNAAGVISADTVRAYKPHREIFDEALRISGGTPEEAIHIGDSYDTDVAGARSAGIRPVLLLRGQVQQHDDVDTVDDLTQALDVISTK